MGPVVATEAPATAGWLAALPLPDGAATAPAPAPVDGFPPLASVAWS